VWGNTAIRHRGCVSWRIKRDTREAGTGCLMLADSFDKLADRVEQRETALANAAD
jgi:hypothetical protein